MLLHAPCWRAVEVKTSSCTLLPHAKSMLIILEVAHHATEIRCQASKLP